MKAITATTIAGLMLLTLLVLLHRPDIASSKSAASEELPRLSVLPLCARSELIVEGTWLGGNQVAVNHVWKSPDGWSPDTTELQVSRMDSLSRVISKFATTAKSQWEIKTPNVTLFLVRDRDSQRWQMFDPEGEGCPSVIWWDETTCYHYGRYSNPGSWELFPWNLPPGEPSSGPVTPQRLRTAIAEGLESEKRLPDDFAIAVPKID